MKYVLKCLNFQSNIHENEIDLLDRLILYMILL